MYRSEDDALSPRLSGIPKLKPASTDAQEKLEPFRLKNEPEHLHGSWMVAAVARDLLEGEQATADQLWSEFGTYFEEDDLKRYWSDPRASFDVALKRAVTHKLLFEGLKGAQLTYITGLEKNRESNDCR